MSASEAARTGGSVRISEASPDSLVVVDPTGLIRRVSGDIDGMLDRHPATLIGRSIEALLTPESADLLMRKVSEVAERGLGSPTIALEGLTAIRGDGTEIPVEVLLVVLASTHEERDSLLVTFRDDRRSAGRREAEREVRERLESSNRDLEIFASVAAHDLQEPLRKIRAFSDRAGGAIAEGDAERAAAFLGRVDAAAARMQTLLDDLLVLARITGQEPDLSRVDVAEVVQGVAEDIMATMPEATVVVSDLPVLRADPIRIRQLFANLIGNAVKYRRDGVAPRVQVSGRHQDGWIEIDVVDNGIGFSNEYRERIFRPFQRLHGRDEYEGTGVGLAICRAVVERHGGQLTAYGRPGEGATFTLMLPQSEPEEDR